MPLLLYSSTSKDGRDLFGIYIEFEDAYSFSNSTIFSKSQWDRPIIHNQTEFTRVDCGKPKRVARRCSCFLPSGRFYCQGAIIAKSIQRFIATQKTLTDLHIHHAIFHILVPALQLPNLPPRPNANVVIPLTLQPSSSSPTVPFGPEPNISSSGQDGIVWWPDSSPWSWRWRHILHRRR